MVRVRVRTTRLARGLGIGGLKRGRRLGLGCKREGFVAPVRFASRDRSTCGGSRRRARSCSLCGDMSRGRLWCGPGVPCFVGPRSKKPSAGGRRAHPARAYCIVPHAKGIGECEYKCGRMRAVCAQAPRTYLSACDSSPFSRLHFTMLHTATLECGKNVTCLGRCKARVRLEGVSLGLALGLGLGSVS